MSDASPQHNGTIPSLDGIRAISVLIVVLAHSGFGKIIPGGLGVTIFFFLSGYLITTLMLAEYRRNGEISIPNFYVRRAFRLVPPLLITLAIAYGLTYAGLLGARITLGGILAQLFYFANYYAIFFDKGETLPAGTAILWSLAIEEHFYIFYPIAMTLILGSAWRARKIGMVFGIACLAILAWRIYLVQLPDFEIVRTYYGSDTRIDSIIYGCILAVVKNPMDEQHRALYISLRQWMLLALAAGVLLFTVAIRDPAFRETLRYTLQGICLMPMFYFSVRFSKNRMFRHLNSEWAIRLGTYSYAIYLIHYVVIGLFVKNAPALAANPLTLFASVLAVSIAYAAAIDRVVDPYFRQLRHRWRSSAGERPAALKNII